MVTEQDKTLEALQIAAQMEIDGKEYYLKASQESSNELGKKLLQSLAAEEDIHRQKFEGIYNAIRNKKAWPVTDPIIAVGVEHACKSGPAAVIEIGAARGLYPEASLSLMHNMVVKINKFLKNRVHEIALLRTHHNPERPLAAFAQPAPDLKYQPAPADIIGVPFILVNN